jgi:hypothetical protein
MTSQGSPYARFRRALATGDVTIVRAAAAEMPVVALADALRICLVLRDADAPGYERAAMRWLGRFCLEAPGATMADVRDAATAFARLPADRSAIATLEALVQRRIG